ncbi:integrase core domain-containing protein [Nonomuraea sediminis]|uniref:integrase core domain-containing protein n=1 Tax=Nonomuraea sediminis TaxID=2835864 RepID=UPI001BDBE72E|nr:integrase core domain-containing protein [Nonomuraea sediminis]
MWEIRSADIDPAPHRQQARNLVMDVGDRIAGMRFLIHDQDPIFTSAFSFKTEGLRGIATLPQTPRMNAICERVIGTLRRELLDRPLILSESHPTLVLREYLIHYNGHRPHQARQQRPPAAIHPPKARRRRRDQRIPSRRLTTAQAA